MTDDDLMPFGIHEGERMGRVPADYLIWLYEKDKLTHSVRMYIRKNEDILRQEIKNKEKP